jgi:hypothetical protein
MSSYRNSEIYHQGYSITMTEKKRLACPCGNTIMRLNLTDSGSLEIECLECGSVMTVGAGICPSRLESYSMLKD